MGRSRLKNSKLDNTVLQKTPSSEQSSKSPATADLPTKALDRICIGFIFLLSMFIYLSTVYPSLPGGDSGELMVTAKEFGVAHPPGYPLFTILAKLAIVALPCGSTAFRVNVLSCILGSLTNALLGACLLKATKNVTVALIICAMTGFSRFFWIWNITGEVFSLNNALCMALLLVMYDFCFEEDTDKKLQLTFVLAILSGFAMTNQHTASMFVMALVCFVLSDLFDQGLITTHNVINLTIAGFSPMILYLQLPLASYLKTARVTWGDHRTGEGFLFHFFRKDYGTLKLVKDDSEVDIWKNYSILTADLMRELTIPVLLLALFSTTAMIWREHDRKFVCFLKTTFVLYTGFFCTFANITDVEGIYKGVLERFWLQASLPLVVMAGIGLQELIRLAKIRKTLMMPVAFLIIAARIHSNYGECNQSENYHVEQFGRHVLSKLPNDTILFTSGDLSTNTFRYLTIAENVRPDVDVLDLSFIGSRWYIPMLAHHMSTVKFPGIGYSPEAPWNSRLYNLEQFLDHNLPKRPVFVCLKPRSVDMVSLRKYKVVPFSFCSQFLPNGAIDPLMYGKQIPTPDLDTYLPPRTELFGDQTWENVLIHEYWDAVVKPGRWLWDAGENTRNIEKKKQLYLAAYEQVPRSTVQTTLGPHYREKYGPW
ncbi:hypothetical protein ACHWQZ_G015380 [Mnemiopsis leidyi]